MALSRLKSSTAEKIISYCVRVIDQSGLTFVLPQNERPGEMQLEQELVDSVLVEAIRILDILCNIDPTLVSQLLHPVKCTID